MSNIQKMSIQCECQYLQIVNTNTTLNDIAHVWLFGRLKAMLQTNFSMDPFQAYLLHKWVVQINCSQTNMTNLLLVKERPDFLVTQQLLCQQMAAVVSVVRRQPQWTNAKQLTQIAFAIKSQQ